MKRTGAARRQFLRMMGSVVVGSGLLSCATKIGTAQQSAENWDFHEDFEQYSIGTDLENIGEWKITNDVSGEGFEIGNTYASEGGEKAVSPVPESGLFQVDAVNTSIVSWQYPDYGFEFRAILSTEGDETQPHAGVAGIGAGIEIDNHPYDGTHIGFNKPTGQQEDVGSVDADSYEIKIEGQTNKKIVGSIRPVGDDSWQSFSTQTDFEGEITGVYLNTNNGGQMDLLRLRKTTDDGSSSNTPASTSTSALTSTPAPTPTPEPTLVSQSDEDDQMLPILLGLLGVGGVGGAGAWWYLRRGGNSISTDDTGTSSLWQSGTEESADSTPLAAVKDSVEEGDNLRIKAQNNIDADRYETALNTYDEVRDAYETAIETATDSDLVNIIDTNEIESKLAAIEDERREIHRQQLEKKVESLRSNLDHAKTLADDDLAQAQQRLETLESDLASARETATQHDFGNLHDEIVTLKQRRENHLTEITERLKAHPIPDNIPRAPNVSVEYDTLINKEPIGRGGNADVTKATLPTPDGDVTLAIKQPRMGGTLHTDQVERMLQEAETWDKLDGHDHIVGVVGYGGEPIPWIAMEYMSGGHLGARSDKMEIPQALWTAIAVTKGVRHAHRKGIAHLDLKPENILFRTIEDAWDVPKVADWGLSKHLLKHSKSIEGLSPQYSAPEQFDDEYGSADDITDIYQLGAVFYELFTGHPPFDGKPTKVMRAVLDDQPSPPSDVADVSRELDEILLTALAKEKNDRYDNIVYLRDDLQELFDKW